MKGRDRRPPAPLADTSRAPVERPMTPQVQAAAGQVVAGKYRLERVIGAGGFGRVFAARHLVLDQPVAVKIMKDHAECGVDSVKRFLREGRIIARMRSEHVTRVHDVGVLDSGAPYIVLEYLEGEDLAERLAGGGPLAVPEAVDHLLQACHALAEAHALGIIHRDLKPANLFCTRAVDGAPLTKVLDFGLAKVHAPAIGLANQSLTKSQHLLGSPAYIAPEQLISPRQVDARADVWSLGVTLYELLTGCLPFDGGSAGEVCLKVMYEPALPLPGLAPNIPAALVALVDRCLSKEPGRRFADVAELCAALSPFGGPHAPLLFRQICAISAAGHRESG
jgi:serine/threonine protein kinase